MAKNSNIRWHHDQPFSETFDDVYFSTENGLAETEYVFLQGNQLPQRWAKLTNEKFTIIETGFGTGLNFLCALDLWLKTAPHASVLHYISVEKYPLSVSDLMRSHQLWPELTMVASALQEAYIHCVSSKNQLELFNGRVVLTLLFDDVIEALPQIKQHADAWFLDGFAPAKNPDMWQPKLFEGMAKISHSETTFATFTSAGHVRRGLLEAGFAVAKRAGFGQKREMLYGTYCPSQLNIKDSDIHNTCIKKNVRTAIVIGAGIAGCASAYALAKRGIKVTLLEQHSQVAMEASGNDLGVLYPRLIGNDIQSEFSLASFLYTTQWLAGLKDVGLLVNNKDYAHCGMLQLAYTPRELARFESLIKSQKHSTLCRLVDATEATKIAGVEIAHHALHIPSAAWIKPRNICRQLIQHPLILFKAQHAVETLTSDGVGWHVSTANKERFNADIVIIANARAAKLLPFVTQLPLQPVRGQVSHHNATDDSTQLSCILCAEGYVSPAVDGQHIIGASFVLDDTDTDIRANENASNLAMLENMSPTLYQSLSTQLHGGRAAIRCASPDHMPLAGAMMHAESLIEAPPRYNAISTTLPWLDGLYVNLAHGSKGMTTAPFCAEFIAAIVAGETPTMDKRFIAALNPNRFTLKSLGLKQLIKTSTIR